MNFSWLESFVHVVEEGNISEAARTLNLTQPAISRQIKNLEQYYGVQLLERSSRESRPTEAGRYVYHQGKEIMAKSFRLKEDLETFKTELRGRIRIGASTIPGEYILPNQVAQFHRRYPYVQLRLDIGDSHGILQGLQRDRYDFAVVGSLSNDIDFTFQPYASDYLIPIVSKDHPFARAGQIQIQSLIGETIIWREEGSGTRLAVEEKMREYNVPVAKLASTIQIGSTEAVVNAVEAGLGVSFVSAKAVEKQVASSRIAVVDLQGFPLQRTLYLVMKRSGQLSAVAERMVDFMSNEKQHADKEEEQ